MKSRIRIATATVVIVVGAFLIPLRAGLIPGVPDIVIDPAAIAKLADQIAKMQTMINNQVALYNQITAQYNMLKRNLEFFTNKNAWKTYGISILNSTVANRHGETVGWNAGVNTGGPAATAAWNVAVLPIESGDFLVRETLGASAHLAALAGIEVLDSAGPNAMATLAAIRQQQATNAAAINHLESTALSGAPDDNTEIKQLNLLNAAQLQPCGCSRASPLCSPSCYSKCLSPTCSSVISTFHRSIATPGRCITSRPRKPAPAMSVTLS